MPIHHERRPSLTLLPPSADFLPLRRQRPACHSRRRRRRTPPRAASCCCCRRRTTSPAARSSSRLTFLLLLFVPARLFHCLIRWRGRLGGWPALPPPIGSSISFAVLVVLLIAGLIGSRDPLANPLPLTVWTLFWIGLTILLRLYQAISGRSSIPGLRRTGSSSGCWADPSRCRAAAALPQLARLLAGRAGLSRLRLVRAGRSGAGRSGAAGLRRW